jgi:hypothetical protein
VAARGAGAAAGDAGDRRLNFKKSPFYRKNRLTLQVSA